ncbi:MAG: hypothetical protein ED859_00085 [Desulfuromonadales bacterium]|nr:MAG: hypothetical protein ED859_00085 [Desulfuromonadales bacterium]
MDNDRDERKRPQHLRLVVNNPDKRNARPATGEESFVSFEELVAKRDGLRPDFYRGLGRWQTRAYEKLEVQLARRQWPYGLDPQHGRLVVIPAEVVCPETLEHGGTPQDEVLIFAADDPTGQGICLSLEMILPFWSDDDAVMEDALFTAPILPYGMLFLEENRNDNYLDLIYRLSFPLFPSALTTRLLERFFAVARYELAETLAVLDAFPEA